MEKLIELAKEKGFKPLLPELQVRQHFLPGGSLGSEIHNYLWMCELQKWLRERIDFILVYPVYSLGGWLFNFDSQRLAKQSINRYDSYEKALENGLIEALKLLP